MASTAGLPTPGFIGMVISASIAAGDVAIVLYSARHAHATYTTTVCAAPAPGRFALPFHQRADLKPRSAASAYFGSSGILLGAPRFRRTRPRFQALALPYASHGIAPYQRGVAADSLA